MRTPEEKAAVVHRTMPNGGTTCQCGHLRREHLGGKGDCDHCDCEGFAPGSPGEPPAVVGNLSIGTDVHPSLCINAKDAREIVRITFDGHVYINPEFSLDEAALAFWRAVEKVAAEHRGRL